jgi:choloylglycine hydrolase
MLKQINALAISLLTCQLAALACTDFKLKAGDGTIVVGRSMEWARPDMNSRMRVHAAGEQCNSVTVSGSQGFKWVSKYAYAGLDGYGLDVVLDGMNSQGLSVGCLW